MPKREQHDPPETLAGQLQRGRGEGIRRINSVTKAEACDLIVDRICNDPRLDSQVESRADYYASLVITFQLDLAPLQQYLRDHDDSDQTSWNTPLTLGTLVELAKRNYKNASEILCDYVKWGQWWNWVLDDLAIVNDSSLHAQVARNIERRFPTDDDLEEALSWEFLDGQSWTTYIRYSARIGQFTDNLRLKSVKASKQQTLPSDIDSLTTEHLLELANRENFHKLNKIIPHVVKTSDANLLIEKVSLESTFVATVAIKGLAKLALPDAFQWAWQFYSANPCMPVFLRWSTSELMRSFPSALTLPVARENLFHEDWHRRHLAENLIKVHATNEDLSNLRAAIAQAAGDDDQNCYRLCNLIEAFEQFPNVGPVPELLDMFRQFRYSYGRRLAAEAIQVTSPQLFQDIYALECLWGCEDDTRILGTRTVPLESEDAVQRLQELASDVCLENDVRAEAGKRITNRSVFTRITGTEEDKLE